MPLALQPHFSARSAILGTLQVALLAGVMLLASATRGAALNLGDILVTDHVSHSILVVNPSTGAQSTLTTGGFLSRPEAIAVNASGEIFVVEGDRFGVGSKIVKVDPGTGAQSVLASGGALFDPHDIALEASGFLVVADFTGPIGLGGVIRINPVTGSQVVIYNALSGGGLPFHLAVETSGKLIFADHNAFGSPLYRLTPFGGTTLLNSDVGAAQGVAIEANGMILVTDAGAFGGTAHVYRVDPVSGARSTVSSGGLLANTGTIAVAPYGDIFVTQPDAIIRVNSITGAQAVVSTGNLFQRLGGIAFYGSAPTPTKQETFGSVKVRYR